MSDIPKRGTTFTPVFYDNTSTVTVAHTVDGPSLAVLHPPTNAFLSELYAGEALGQFDACYIKASDNKVYKSKVNVNAVPAAPVCTNTADGTGLWNGQALLVTATYVTAEGESTPSIPTLFKITTTGQLHIATTGYTGLDASILSMNFYVNNILFANGTVTATNLAAALDISGATPTLGGNAAPRTNTAFKDGAYKVDGYAFFYAPSGEAVTLVENVEVAYTTGTGLAGLRDIYLSAAVAGAIANAAPANATGFERNGKVTGKIAPTASTVTYNIMLWATRK